MNRLTIATLVGALMLAPAAAEAVTLASTIGTISEIINSIIPIILALAVLYFFWGVAQYVMNAEDKEKRGKAISTMIMGIIAIFVMVSIWGIIAILQETFKVGGAAPIIPPKINVTY
tara:strand:+ start:18759 stop:19109 length:351 start_codon:yes stop_codon:yes gene_type:complete